jgi:hypothetical protein
VLAARSQDERHDFWRYWVGVTLDPTRRVTPEMRRAVDTLVARSRALRPLGPQELARWVVAQRMDTTRYQIDRVAPLQTSGGEWWVARTWLRSSHEYEQRYACAVVGGRLIVLESGPILTPETSATFDRVLVTMTPVQRSGR